MPGDAGSAVALDAPAQEVQAVLAVGDPVSCGDRCRPIVARALAISWRSASASALLHGSPSIHLADAGSPGFDDSERLEMLFDVERQ